MDFSKANIYSVFLPRLNQITFVRISIRKKNPVPIHNVPFMPFLDILDLLIYENEEVSNENIKLLKPLTYSIATTIFPPKTNKLSKWKFLFSDELKSYEMIYPEERKTNTGETFPDYDEKKLDWFHIVNGMVQKFNESWFTPLKYIKHLGYQSINNNQILLTDIITILWLKKLNLPFMNFYTEDELTGNFWLKIIMIQANHTVFYNDVPEAYWNRIWRI